MNASVFFFQIISCFLHTVLKSSVSREHDEKLEANCFLILQLHLLYQLECDWAKFWFLIMFCISFNMFNWHLSLAMGSHCKKNCFNWFPVKINTLQLLNITLDLTLEAVAFCSQKLFHDFSTPAANCICTANTKATVYIADAVALLGQKKNNFHRFLYLLFFRPVSTVSFFTLWIYLLGI